MSCEVMSYQVSITYNAWTVVGHMVCAKESVCTAPKKQIGGLGLTPNCAVWLYSIRSAPAAYLHVCVPADSLL